MQKRSDVQGWASGVGQIASHIASEREDEIARVLRALDEALIEDDRAEILTQFDRAVVLLGNARRWHEGLAAARDVFTAVARWEEFDAAPYALTLAQFAHNYALELQQARVFEAAEDLYREALSIFAAHGDAAREMATVHQLGRVLQDQCQYKEAAQAYRRSLELARERCDCARVGANLFHLAQVAQLAGNLRESEDLYQQALTESLPNMRLEAAAAHQLGIIAQTRGDYVTARARFETALERARQRDDAQVMAAALHQLGMMAQARGELTRAEELYRQSLDCTALIDGAAEAAPTLFQLAQLAQQSGDGAGAEHYARQSLALVQAQGDVGAIRRVLKLMEPSRRVDV